METYSVKQIAEMLNTNPETVRRWIRDKKLKAVQVSKKEGNVITESELQRFLKAMPKYAPRYTASMMSSPAFGLPAALVAFLGGTLINYYDEKKKVEQRILSEDIQNYLRDSIRSCEESIRKKKRSIKQLELEIEKEKQEVERLKLFLEQASSELGDVKKGENGNGFE